MLPCGCVSLQRRAQLTDCGNGPYNFPSYKQVAANTRGIQLVRDLIAEYGLSMVQAFMRHICANAEAAVREMLQEFAAAQVTSRLSRFAASSTGYRHCVASGRSLYMLRCTLRDLVGCMVGCMVGWLYAWLIMEFFSSEKRRLLTLDAMLQSYRDYRMWVPSLRMTVWTTALRYAWR